MNKLCIILLMFLCFFFPNSPLYSQNLFNTINFSQLRNYTFTQGYNSYNQGQNKVFNISGNWISDHRSETILLSVNQINDRYSWVLNYYDQGLTASGYGTVSGTTINIMTNLPGRSVPSSGQVLNYDDNGNATSIEFEYMTFYRQQ